MAKKKEKESSKMAPLLLASPPLSLLASGWEKLYRLHVLILWILNYMEIPFMPHWKQLVVIETATSVQPACCLRWAKTLQF